ncbi:MAG: hypothetical protein AB8I08_12505 [Sandaracinaceae bacterium]
MRVEELKNGSRAVVVLPGPVDAAACRALEDTLRTLPDHLKEVVLMLEPGARIVEAAVPSLTRVWRGLVRREVRTVFVSNRALQRDVARGVMADAGDSRSTVTVSRAIAEEWLAQARKRRRRGSDTLTQMEAMEAVQSRMKSLRDSVGE